MVDLGILNHREISSTFKKSSLKCRIRIPLGVKPKESHNSSYFILFLLKANIGPKSIKKIANNFNG